MKKIFCKLLSLLLVLSLAGCFKNNYFPDENNPGLSRLTSYGFNIATFYLNDVPYINPYSLPFITKIVTNSTFDTLMLSWRIGINDNGNANLNSPYQMISLLMPIPKSFSKADFIAMRGISFTSNTNGITLQYYPYQSDSLLGSSNIYFVKINPIQTSDTTANLELSGIFNGSIHDSILITKGRFDFQIAESSLNF